MKTSVQKVRADLNRLGFPSFKKFERSGFVCRQTGLGDIEITYHTDGYCHRHHTRPECKKCDKLHIKKAAKGLQSVGYNVKTWTDFLGWKRLTVSNAKDKI